MQTLLRLSGPSTDLIPLRVRSLLKRKHAEHALPFLLQASDEIPAHSKGFGVVGVGLQMAELLPVLQIPDSELLRAALSANQQAALNGDPSKQFGLRRC